MPPKVINWTDDLCKELIGHAERGLSAGQIAHIFSKQLDVAVSRNSIIGKCHRLKITLGRKPEERADKAAEKAAKDAEKRAKAQEARQARAAEKAKERAEDAPVAPPAPPPAPTAIVIQIEAAFRKAQPIGNPRRWIPRAGGCKYPLGEPRDPGFRYCGEPVFEQDHYCATHGLRCYVQTEGFSAKRRRRERAAALELASAAE